MSFGDLASMPRSAESEQSALASAANAATELHGNLRALAANSAALRLWESADDAQEELQRVRALRSQNRDLVRNAVSLLTNIEAAAAENDDAALSAEAEDLREQLRETIQDFSDALRESIARERDAVAAARPEPANVSSLPELGESRAPLSTASGSETAPLLSANASEEALRRELESTAGLREQRMTALREINTSVTHVNSIMVDLANMIGEQATSLEFVAVNVEDSLSTTAAARRQLLRARKGRERKQRLFFLGLALIASVIAVLIVILFS